MWVANFVENGAVAKDIISEFDRLWNSERACDYVDFIEDYRIRYKIKKEQQKLARESEVISIEKYKLEPNSMQVKFIESPIFVTYEKKDDIANSTKYEDQFINNQLFSWMTRSKVSLESSESQKIINYSKIGLKIYLFIKKSDGEGTDFYYMGKVSPIDYMQTEIENDNGQKLPIMNFKMKLEHSVREDIYEYFVG